MGIIKQLIPILRYLGAVFLISVGIVMLAWAYSKPNISFGVGWIGIVQKFGYLWTMVGAITLGLVMFMYSRKTKKEGMSVKRLMWAFIGTFAGIKFGLFVCTWVVGVPFDSSYAFGINAIQIAKAIVILLPAVVFIVALITILIIKPENFWFAVIRMLFLVGLLIILAVVVIPRVNALY